MKVKLHIGRRPYRGGPIYLIPTLAFIHHLKSSDELHSLCIESQIIRHGIGIRLEWLNKKYKPQAVIDF